MQTPRVGHGHRQPVTGWGGFAAWGLVGGLLSFSVLSAASIGLLVLPVAVVALVFVGTSVQVVPEVAGALEGAAAVSLLVAFLNWGTSPCPNSSSGVVAFAPGTPNASSSCGGLNPWPWLLIGLTVAALGAAVYGLARRPAGGAAKGRAAGRFGRAAAYAIAGLLLLSAGGLGVIGGPVTLPLIYVMIRRHPTRAVRIAGSIIGGVTAAELSWGVLYLVAGEVPVAIWLVPLVAGLATAYGFARLPARS